MKIKLDENLPRRVVIELSELGHDVHTAHDEGLIGHSDSDLWRAAQNEARFLITQDLDFSDLRQFAPGSHYGLMLLRLRSPSRSNLSSRILELFRDEDVAQWHGCFVVATERKIRIIRQKRSS